MVQTGTRAHKHGFLRWDLYENWAEAEFVGNVGGGEAAHSPGQYRIGTKASEHSLPDQASHDITAG